jgi:hypothetical protein
MDENNGLDYILSLHVFFTKIDEVISKRENRG